MCVQFAERAVFSFVACDLMAAVGVNTSEVYFGAACIPSVFMLNT